MKRRKNYTMTDVLCAFIIASAPNTRRQFCDTRSDLRQTAGIHEFSKIHNEKFRTRTFHSKHPVYKYLKMRFFFF